MPKFTTESKWLKHEDLSEDEDTVVVISDVKREMVDKENNDKKWVVYFGSSLEGKGLCLNKTNGNAIIKALGTNEMDDWRDQAISLWVKDDVEYAGKIVSGIRVRPRQPKNNA